MKNVSSIFSILFVALCLVFFLPSCDRLNGNTKVSATGTIYECLVVMDKTPLTSEQLARLSQSQIYGNGSAYDEPIANMFDLVRAVLEADMPCMPQMEPYFKVTNVPSAAFDDFLKPTRNILIIDINADRYTSVKAKYSTDYWSYPQAVFRIQAPDADSFIAYWEANGESVRDWFVRSELSRQKSFYKGYTNHDARETLQKTIGVDMFVPEDYMLIKDTTDFVWCCNNGGPMRKDLIVYKYPYTDAETFTLPYLCSRRDEILGKHIHAGIEGSHMGTEYDVFPPQIRPISGLDSTQSGDFYGMELRGLWKMLDGEAMGGPFVSHTRIDEINHQVITAEVYVFAPGQKKRTAIRQAEAILYTLKLEQEINKLDEIDVTK